MPNDPLTLAEAADHLGVHYMTVYRYVRTGLLPATKFGGSWLISPTDLETVKRGRLSPRPKTNGAKTTQVRLLSRLLAGTRRGRVGAIGSHSRIGHQTGRHIARLDRTDTADSRVTLGEWGALDSRRTQGQRLGHSADQQTRWTFRSARCEVGHRSSSRPLPASCIPFPSP